MTATTFIAPAAAPAMAKHALATSVLLHLFPGAAMAAIYVAIAPLGMSAGLPPLLILSVLALAVLAPLELGHLLLVGRRGAGRWSLRDAVDLPRLMPAWRFGLILLVAVAAALVLYGLSQPADRWFAGHVMGFLPPWFDYSGLASYRRLGRGVLITTVVLRFVADVVVLPAAEELYFRGYLMPRIAGPGWTAPLASAGLFAAYHFWQPYNWPSIFCFSLPMIVAAWWWKDVRLSIAAHVALNLIGFAAFAVAVLRP